MRLAGELNVSRSTVSRLLQQAVDRGVVRIIIDYPWERAHDLEQRLMTCFHLREVQVLLSKGRDDEKVREGMGMLAARLIDRDITDNAILGISYGRSLACTIAALAPTRQVATSVIPIIGALGSDNPFIDGPELVRRFAQIYGGEFRYLPAPLLVDEVRTRNALSAISTDYRDLVAGSPGQHRPDGHRRAGAWLFQPDLGGISRRA